MSDASPGKKLGRLAAYPLIRLLEPRFADLVRRLTDTRQAVHDEAAATRDAVASFEHVIAGYAASSGESLTFVGTQLRELTDELRSGGRRGDGDGAAVPAGPAAIEDAFALRALGRLEPGGRVLDVQGAERPVAMALGTLGFDVEAVDDRPYVHEHPRVMVVAPDLEQLSPDSPPFDAALCLSGLPGSGADADDPWAADAAALELIRARLVDDGLAVLALAGGDGVGGGRAHYDTARLDALLDAWDVLERVYVREQLPGTWVSTDAPAGRTVVLVAATPA